MKITKNIQLDETLSLDIERISNDYGFIEKHFYLNDDWNQTRQKLAILSNGRWTSQNPANLSRLFELSKKHKSRISRNINKGFDFEHEITVQKRFNCFKRNFKIQISKITHKAKIKTTDAIQNILR